MLQTSGRQSCGGTSPSLASREETFTPFSMRPSVVGSWYTPRRPVPQWTFTASSPPFLRKRVGLTTRRQSRLGTGPGPDPGPGMRTGTGTGTRLCRRRHRRRRWCFTVGLKHIPRAHRLLPNMLPTNTPREAAASRSRQNLFETAPTLALHMQMRSSETRGLQRSILRQ